MTEQTATEFLEDLSGKDYIDDRTLENAEQFWRGVTTEDPEPVIGVSVESDIHFSWELGELYFEVEFMDDEIEGFYEGDGCECLEFMNTEQAAEFANQVLNKVS